jgi:type IV pilus assembly protein PilY1
MTPTVPTLRQAVAYVLACTLIWVDLAPLARANTDIADIPMATRSRAKPNMIIAVDDSGSMDGEVLPARPFTSNDGALWWNTAQRTYFGFARGAAVGACSGGVPPVDGDPFAILPVNSNPAGITNVPSGAINFNYCGSASDVWKKYTYLFPNTACGRNCDTRSYGDNENDHFAVPPTREFAWVRSPLYNSQYYNPAINYDPWRPYNDGSTTRTPPSYDNGGTGRNWNAVRSHPYYPTPTTTGTNIDLTNTVAQPGDAAATDRTFRMYPGMIIPNGARFRRCASTNNGSCGPWQDNVDDRCYTNTTNVDDCRMRSFYGIPIGAPGRLDGSGSDHLDVQIQYWPATFWIASTSTATTLAADEALGPDGRRLRRVEIRSGVTSYAKGVARTDCVGATCTYAEEMQNFANWWAYYRKRLLALNAAMGLGFDQVRGIRVGHFLFNNRVNVTMYDFDATADASNGRRLLGLLYNTKGDGGTPTRRSLEFAGKQFERTGSGAPVIAECQYNAAFVITDGFANNELPVDNYGNEDSNANIRFTTRYDANVPSLNLTTATPAGIIPPAPTEVPPITVTPGSPYADPYVNTLADIAMHYYTFNLRPDITPIRQVPVDPNDLAPDADRNDYIHMATFVLGLGVQGLIFNNAAYPDQNRDPYANPPDWTLGGNPTGQVRNPSSVDELWHATINGRGAMLSADTPESTRSGVVDIANKVGARGGSGAAVAVANPNVTPGDNFSYASSYNSGSWAGDINKFSIDLVSGAVSTTGIWSPSPQRALAVRDPATRVIATFHPTLVSASQGGGVPFQWADISAAQQSALTPVAPAPGTGTEVLNFLRGDRTREVEAFRSRGPRPPFPNNVTPSDISVLGSIVNSEPVVIGPPLFSYFDNGYAAFRSANAARAAVVYQGANDGMLHAFSSADGSELWAYIPSFVFSNLRNLSDRNAFSHRYYVDGTPTMGDVDLNFTNGVDLANPPTPDWRTMLVGGLRKGGMGFYALDVTSPSMGNETTLASRVLWEFPNASMTATDRAKVGFSFGKPIIAKTRAAGWVVIVSSGYNNGTTGASGFSGGDGIGRIFVLNARTGALIREISTGVGTTSNASGLAHLAAFTERPQVDATIESVYGGDLLGNLWRFDLSGATTVAWAVTRVATITDGSGNIQPITVEPELGVINRNRYIYFGAGQYLGDSDIPSNVPENVYAQRRMSFYGIRDNLGVTGAGPVYASPVRSGMIAQTITKGAGTATLTSNPVSPTATGWFVDMTEDGERIVTNPILSGGVITFTSNIPVGGTNALCTPGGRSWAWFVDFATGGRVTLAGSPTHSGVSMGNVLSSRPVLVRLPGGNIVGLVRGSDSQTRTINPPSNTASGTGRRLSWREIVQ